MPRDINDYYAMIKMPWSRMFYDMVWRQLDVPEAPRLRILDYGSGFCVTADYYAQNHNVTAIEPNPEMSALRFRENEYKQLDGGLDILSELTAESFDLVICHNVLDYTNEREKIFAQLARVLKIGGRLSIIKHNRLGRALAAAVFDDNPAAANEIISDANASDAATMFGGRSLYENSELYEWAKTAGLHPLSEYGIRAFFALSRNNEIKFGEEWYAEMLKLEMNVCDMDEFKRIAMFNHIILSK